MSKSANKTLIGAFVVGATALLLLAIAVFGSGKLSFDFHWADGMQKLGDIDEFLLNGDQAPSRRANYHFEE